MFEICADAPAVAGPESASNIQTRIREDFFFCIRWGQIELPQCTFHFYLGALLKLLYCY